MCGRFETTGKFTWAEIHDALFTIAPVTTPPLNLQPDDDVRPTTMQATARLESDGIPALAFDGGASIADGSWLLIPVRVMVDEDDLSAAKVIADAA